MRALVIEDDPVSARLIEQALKAENMISEPANCGEDGIELGKLYDFDIIVLDLRLPDMEGYEVVRRLRAAKVQTPILILSGRTDPTDKVRGLMGGADDYLTKPFNKAELVARIQAIVRRSKGHAESVIRTGKLQLNMDARSVEADGRRLHVTGKEYSILELLSLRKGTTLTKEMFLDHLYGGMDEPELKIIDVFICKLRKKLSEATGGEHYIETVWGRGYVLKDPEPVEQRQLHARRRLIGRPDPGDAGRPALRGRAPHGTFADAASRPVGSHREPAKCRHVESSWPEPAAGLSWPPAGRWSRRTASASVSRTQGSLAAVRGAAIVRLAVGDDVFVDDILRTGADSRALIVCLDGLQITIGPGDRDGRAQLRDRPAGRRCRSCSDCCRGSRA